MQDYAGGFAMMAIALDEHLAQPKTLILRGKEDAIRAWRQELTREFLPDTEVLALPDSLRGLPPLLDKPRRPEPVNAWLCRGVTCLEPISDLVHLKANPEGESMKRAGYWLGMIGSVPGLVFHPGERRAGEKARLLRLPHRGQEDGRPVLQGRRRQVPRRQGSAREARREGQERQHRGYGGTCPCRRTPRYRTPTSTRW